MGLEILSWMMVGLITGALARVAMPGPAAGGIRVAVLIGVLGALTGGLLGTAFLAASQESFDWRFVAIAANGALYSLFIYRCVATRFDEKVDGRTWLPTGEIRQLTGALASTETEVRAT